MNKTLLIVGGVAAVGIVGYMLYKKNKSNDTSDSAATTDASAQKEADTTTTSAAKPNRQFNPAQASKPMATSPKGGVTSKGVTSTPSTLSPTDPTVSSGVTINTGRYMGITDADFERMEKALLGKTIYRESIEPMLKREIQKEREYNYSKSRSRKGIPFTVLFLIFLVCPPLAFILGFIDGMK